MFEGLETLICASAFPQRQVQKLRRVQHSHPHKATITNVDRLQATPGCFGICAWGWGCCWWRFDGVAAAVAAAAVAVVAAAAAAAPAAAAIVVVAAAAPAAVAVAVIGTFMGACEGDVAFGGAVGSCFFVDLL